MNDLLFSQGNFLSKRFFRPRFQVLWVFGLYFILSGEVMAQQSQWLWLKDKAQIKSLDSLIHLSPQWALKTEFYSHALLDSLIQFPNNLKGRNDSLLCEQRIANVAQSFFEDLSFGNPRPTFKFQGYAFELRKKEVSQLIQEYMKKKSIVKLANHLNSPIEIKILLASLQVQRDSLGSKSAYLEPLVQSINRYRWLNHVRKNTLLTVVNIPAASLKVYQGDQVALQMKVVLGRPARPTRELSSQIKNIIINPNWFVPRSIATEELLPEIQKNLRYFYASHLELLDRNNQVVDAAKVNWKKLSKEYFPYSFRQRTGVWNTLGIMKITFDNPYRLYLHDTSEKKLFASSKRFYSHGCIRLEDPIAYGKLLLSPNTLAMDTLNIKGPYHDIPSKWIKVNKKAPLIIWNNLVDIDEKGAVVYWKNVY
ncbi:hypothetical protein ESB04_03210 [Aquirufa rosea]|uniref:L,D-TPase catalytic domain-containing protein n=1 Tax=Aquirufa rosea TaxID=2509241 RepID=A0A4Q1C0P2_9BACT|nr:hypothetical protein ESB04_03210 [Aquirufa rosea]